MDMSNYIWIGIVVMESIKNSKKIVFPILEIVQLQLQSICNLVVLNCSSLCVLQGTMITKMSNGSLCHPTNAQTIGLPYGGNALT